MLEPRQPLALYMEGALGDYLGKLGYGALRYSTNPIACVIDSRHAGKDVREVVTSPRSCPVVAGLDEAIALGSEVFVLGIAPSGGLLPESWWRVIDEAVARGLCVVNGLHDRIAPRYESLAPGQWIWDIRVEPPGLLPATGAARLLANRRLVTLGTDMGAGKMTAGLEILRAARARGLRAEFIATGQIGILITGSGVPLDAVRVDYACGAIEREVLRLRDAELVIVEGQGAIIHPGSTSTLPLLRGAMATHFVLCHRAGMARLRRHEEIAVPPLREVIRLYEEIGSAAGCFPRPRACGVALITEHLPEDEAMQACREVEAEVGLPCVDPVRFGAEALLDGAMS
jgi:uncharacterized NAD-dependent epimerase/dehydratase family protein